MLKRASAFVALGYRTAILRDDDKRPDPAEEAVFELSGEVFKWQEGRKIEAEIFASVPSGAAISLLDLALEDLEQQVLDAQLSSASGNKVSIASIREEALAGELSPISGEALGEASGRKSGWFKTVGAMERAAREIIGDPMQEVFNWRGHHPDWDDDVVGNFPLVAELTRPWRWENAGAHELGAWLLEARRTLKSGGRIDLRTAPPDVSWIHLDGVTDHEKQRRACLT